MPKERPSKDTTPVPFRHRVLEPFARGAEAIGALAALAELDRNGQVVAMPHEDFEKLMQLARNSAPTS